MQLAHFSNQTIHDRCQFLVRSERKVTAEILEYIAEIAAREIFLERGYNSLLAYLIKEMGYSKTAALRRMDGAKLLKGVSGDKREVRLWFAQLVASVDLRSKLAPEKS